jgi:hypothetical protein
MNKTNYFLLSILASLSAAHDACAQTGKSDTPVIRDSTNRDPTPIIILQGFSGGTGTTCDFVTSSSCTPQPIPVRMWAAGQYHGPATGVDATRCTAEIMSSSITVNQESLNTAPKPHTISWALAIAEKSDTNTYRFSQSGIDLQAVNIRSRHYATAEDYVGGVPSADYQSFTWQAVNNRERRHYAVLCDPFGPSSWPGLQNFCEINYVASVDANTKGVIQRCQSVDPTLINGGH